MIITEKPSTILLADDDLDDCQLTNDALEEGHLSYNLRCVHDGDDLLDYLFRRAPYTLRDAAPRPGLILLELNMPRMDGIVALAEIKADSELRRIPIVVLTTSRSETDIRRCYDLGANSFISKPSTFGGLVEIMQSLARYWFELVRLPLDRRQLS